ncbi:copper amine oxidase N-terminal domain-containing protein [Cohnella hashimotonis]|uniref:Copper amine oxidase N-terminal domain-containing protein n=1 Tax=Cohnella hashimotonis TaxID=2826895 RepID=A0ABT6TPK2_9BACL|nr:copper amine oxidase N-terminal domain-containing protein [Cohnella hashimotonis]MDI4648786.1 copper amine oxidase N-terminal domain-containing protein [Cohnella hashimotonis]
MKRNWRKSLASMALAASLLMLPVSQAAALSLSIDGNVQKLDVDPVMVNNTVLVPMKGTLDPLGAKLQWNGSTQTVTAVKGDTVVTLKIGESVATVKKGSDVTRITLDQPGALINNRVMVPVRFLVDQFGAAVTWDKANQTVVVTTADAPQTTQGAKGDKGDK